MPTFDEINKEEKTTARKLRNKIIKKLGKKQFNSLDELKTELDAQIAKIQQSRGVIGLKKLAVLQSQAQERVPKFEDK